MSNQETEPADPFRDATRNATLVHLAVKVMEANGRSLPSLTSAGGPDPIKSFRAAVVQAETMLKAVENRGEEDIHAYRLFPFDPMCGSAPQSVNEILDQFKDAGWKGRMSEGTLRTRIDEILREIEEETSRRREGLLCFLERHGFREPADNDIDGLVTAVLEDFAIPGAIGDVEQLRLQMAAVIRRMLDKAMAPYLRESGTSESPTDPLTIAHFMRFVCGRDTYEEAKVANSGGTLLLRPYELFLFAHERKFLTEKLTKPRKALNPDFVPQPEYSSSLSIMVAHGGAGERLEEWGKEDQERRRRREVLEKRTEEQLALRRQEEVDQNRTLTKRGAEALGKKAAKDPTPEKHSTKKKAPRRKA